MAKDIYDEIGGYIAATFRDVHLNLRRNKQEQRTPAEVARDAAHLARIVREGLDRRQYYIVVHPTAKTVKLSLEYFLDAPPEAKAKAKAKAKAPRKPSAARSKKQAPSAARARR